MQLVSYIILSYIMAFTFAIATHAIHPLDHWIGYGMNLTLTLGLQNQGDLGLTTGFAVITISVPKERDKNY